MVAFYKKYVPFVLLWGIFLAGGCKNDVLGLFYSADLESRWQERDTFNFLNSADRNISLGDAYSFIVISDTHIYKGDTGGLEKLKNSMDGDVQFVVFNGDITQNGEKEDIRAFIRIAQSLGVPCYPVAGNHDIYFGNWPAWKELIGSTCYRVNGTSATFFMLDSANAYLGAEQLDWLESELNNAAGRVFIFSHVNLFASHSDMQQFTDTRERARVTSLLKGRCEAMFMGHAHQRNIQELGGVKYITMEDYRNNAVYCQVWVSKDNVRWEFKKL